MNNPLLRLTGAVLLIALGIGAGAWLHSSRGTAPVPSGIPVAAGQASPPNPSDLAHEDTMPGVLLPGVATPGGAASGNARGDVAPGATATGDTADDIGGLPSRATIPERLPSFSLRDRNGRPTSIATFAGQSLIINFWATWCAPCRREIPLLQALQAEWAGRGATVIGIAVDHRDPVLEFADRFKMAYPLLIGEQDALDAAAALGVDSPVFPFTVFTDRRGDVVALFVGELHRPQAELILGEVQHLNQGTIELQAARQAIALGVQQLAAKHAG
jgi:thiol-disulfide isomerase/thioredoxin